MAEMLFHLLHKEDCTVRELRSFLESQPNVQSIINQPNGSRFPPIIEAFLKGKSLDIMEELMKHGADANRNFYQWVPLTAVWSFGYDKCETYYCDTIRLLIKYGADVNRDIRGKSPFYKFVSNYCHSRTKIFIPIIQIMLPYADTSAKMTALDLSLRHVLDCPEPYEEEGDTEGYIQAVKLLLKSGTSLHLGLTVSFFLLALQSRLYYPEIDSTSVMVVFKMVLPYLFMQQSYSENALNEMQNRVDGIISEVFIPSCSSESLPDLLVGLWDDCVEEWNDMQSDMTKEGSILHILLVMGGMKSDRTNVTREVVFELLLRFAKNKYPCFQDIMCDAIKNSDMRELYVFIVREISGKMNLLDLDCFYYMAKYLEKDDLFNFLLALLSRQV